MDATMIPVDAAAVETAAPPSFRGSIPEVYDRYLGPALFRPYAIDLARRLPSMPYRKAVVVELACGTGQLTRILRYDLPPFVHLIATDVSESMLAHAQELFGPSDDVEWRQEDMTELWCDDGCADAVLCQFGIMFADDKQKAFHEAGRILKRGGRFLFNTWDAMTYNELAACASDVVGSFFPDVDTRPQFCNAPFGFNNHEQIRSMLTAAGFRTVEIETVHKTCIVPSAHDAATGLIYGTPAILAIQQAGAQDVGAIVDCFAQEIASRWGDHPVRTKMQAIVVTAHKG